MTRSPAKTIFAIPALALAALLGAASLAQAADWPGYHGPNRDRITQESGWMNEWENQGPEMLWRKNLGPGYSSVAVVGDHVYTMGYDTQTNEDVVYCLDIATGEPKWTHRYPCEIIDNMHEGGPAATPTIYDGKVYTISKEGHFHCLDAANGDVIFAHDLKEVLGVETPTWGFSGSPLILGDHVVVDMGVIAAFTLDSGELVWKTENYGEAYASPVEFEWNGETLIAAFPRYGLVILQAEDGEQVTKFPWETSYGVNAATPIVHGDTIFISSGYNVGCAKLQLREGTSPEVVWRNKEMRNQFNASVLYEGYLYGFDESDLVCLNYETGDVAWREERLGKSSLIIADGNLVIQSENGELIIAPASPDGFEPTGRMQVLGGTNWTCPVLANGYFVGRNAIGHTVALDMTP